MVKIAVIIVTLTLFFTAAFAEIGGGYLVWLWLRKNKVLLFGLVGGMVLFVYGIIQTLQPANFGRVYAAYGGIFVPLSIIWGALVDKKRPDRYELVGSLIAISRAAIIFYAPR